MLRRLVPLGLMAVMICGLTTNATTTAAPIILDDFSTSPGVWTFPTPFGTLQSPPLSPRELILGPPGLQVPGDAIVIDTKNQLFRVATAPRHSSDPAAFTTTLKYSVTGSFTPSNAVGLHFLTLDLPMNMQLIVDTTSGTLSKTISVLPGSNFNLIIDFSGLSGSGNLANTTGISLVFNSSAEPDVDFILRGDTGGIKLNGEIPEPATLASFGLMGLVGGLVLRRKLRHRQLANA